MPMKVKTAAAATAVLPHISSELLDQIVTGPMTQQGIEEGDLWACVRRQPCGHRVDQQLSRAPESAARHDSRNHQ